MPNTRRSTHPFPSARARCDFLSHLIDPLFKYPYDSGALGQSLARYATAEGLWGRRVFALAMTVGAIVISVGMGAIALDVPATPGLVDNMWALWGTTAFFAVAALVLLDLHV